MTNRLRDRIAGNRQVFWEGDLRKDAKPQSRKERRKKDGHDRERGCQDRFGRRLLSSQTFWIRVAGDGLASLPAPRIEEALP
jgi:hypothetical protein